MAGIKQPVDTIIELSLLLQPAMVTNKGGSRRLEKSHKNRIHFHGQGQVHGQGQCRGKLQGHGQGQCKGEVEGHGQEQCRGKVEGHGQGQ